MERLCNVYCWSSQGGSVEIVAGDGNCLLEGFLYGWRMKVSERETGRGERRAVKYVRAHVLRVSGLS